VILSVALATAISLITLWLAVLFRVEAIGQRLRKAASAALMGTAIAGMHYTAMAAAGFTSSDAVPDLSHAVTISSLGVTSIAITSVMLLVVALLTCLLDRLEFSAMGQDVRVPFYGVPAPNTLRDTMDLEEDYVEFFGHRKTGFGATFGREMLN